MKASQFYLETFNTFYFCLRYKNVMTMKIPRDTREEGKQTDAGKRQEDNRSFPKTTAMIVSAHEPPVAKDAGKKV
jgi:hypothetical protein